MYSFHDVAVAHIRESVDSLCNISTGRLSAKAKTARAAIYCHTLANTWPVESTWRVRSQSVSTVKRVEKIMTIPIRRLASF
jgi:hypothetical protein